MYQRIFVAIDGSETSRRALDHALLLAVEQHAHVRIVHAIEWIEHLALSLSGGYPVDFSGLAKSRREEGQRVLADAKTESEAAGLEAEFAILEGKEPMDRTGGLLVQDADKWDADLIVIGSHGRTGLARFVLGSVAESVIRTAQRPVLLIHGELSGFGHARAAAIPYSESIAAPRP
jgi:nucleotide-binding universal stress UspA family protein